MSDPMTPAEALEYHQAGNYRLLADGSPWPYITGILGDPEHPEHRRVLESITHHKETALQRYCVATTPRLRRGQDYRHPSGIVIPAHEVDRMLDEGAPEAVTRTP